MRLTETTVGSAGLAAMPGALPPASAYTYNVEFNVQEAIDQGARSVQFSQPAVFISRTSSPLPVGTPMPLGTYDPANAAWLPENSGKVVKIVGITPVGAAELDTDGNGSADCTTSSCSLAGVTAAEPSSSS